MTRTRPRGLKISQIAKQAGVSIPTVKHYLNEGLLPRPVKTGRTMSYYDAECVGRIRLIKKLQNERFLPLGIIRKILDSGGSFEAELALGEALLNIAEEPKSRGVVSRKSVARRTGFPLAKIDRMEAAGLIRPRRTGRGVEYDLNDCQVISLVRQREEAGLPFDYSLEMMSIYRKHIANIVREDSKLFVRRMLKDTGAGDAARYIREGDRALGAFMSLIKARLIAENAENTIETMNAAADNVREALRFRSLRLPPTPTVSDRKSIHSALVRALGKGARAGITDEGDSALAAISLSIGDLMRGHAESALRRLRHEVSSKELAPLASVLTGLAHVGRTPSVPGLLPAIQAVTQATACFEESRRINTDPEIYSLVLYLRGVGLAIVPEVFDTHDAAAKDLTMVAEATRLAHATGEDRSAWSAVMREMRLKAQHFLASMRLGDDRHESAMEILDVLSAEGDSGFYGRWARKQIRAVERKSRHSASASKMKEKASGLQDRR